MDSQRRERELKTILMDLSHQGRVFSRENFFRGCWSAWTEMDVWTQLYVLYSTGKLSRRGMSELMETWIEYASIENNVFLIINETLRKEETSLGLEAKLATNQTGRLVLTHLRPTLVFKKKYLSDNFTPEEVARQYTYLEREIMLGLRPREFKATRWNDRDRSACPLIMESIDVFNFMGNHIMADLLNRPLAEMPPILTYYLKVARLLIDRHHNFNGLMAVMSCLERWQIARLRPAWKKVSHGKMSLYHRFLEILSPHNNHRNYRVLVEGLGQKDISYLPIISLLLRDITHIYEAVPKCSPDGSVNLERINQIGELLGVFNQIRGVSPGNRPDEFRQFLCFADLLSEDTLTEKSYQLLPPLTSSPSSTGSTNGSRLSMVSDTWSTLMPSSSSENVSQLPSPLPSPLASPLPSPTTSQTVSFLVEEVLTHTSKSSSLNSVCKILQEAGSETYYEAMPVRPENQAEDNSRAYYRMWSKPVDQWTEKEIGLWHDKLGVTGTEEGIIIDRSMAEQIYQNYKRTGLPYPRYMNKTDVSVWLENNYLAHLIPRFLQEEINGLSLINLTEEELDKLGVRTLGQRVLFRRLREEGGEIADKKSSRLSSLFRRKI